MRCNAVHARLLAVAAVPGGRRLGRGGSLTVRHWQALGGRHQDALQPALFTHLRVRRPHLHMQDCTANGKYCAPSALVGTACVDMPKVGWW